MCCISFEESRSLRRRWVFVDIGNVRRVGMIVIHPFAKVVGKIVCTWIWRRVFKVDYYKLTMSLIWIVELGLILNSKNIPVLRLLSVSYVG